MFELLAGGSLSVKVIWLPKVDGNPGTDFYLKYRLKGESKWLHTSVIELDDFVVIGELSPSKIYEMAVVSVEGGFEAESDIQEFIRGI